jgi:hypothetical protein
MTSLRRRRGTSGGDLEGRLVWIVGGPRTGSSWLLDLLTYPLRAAPTRTGVALRDPTTDLRPFALPINEPYLGAHLAPIETIHPFGVFTPAEVRDGDPSYFFAPEYEAVWRPRLRTLILDRLAAQADAAADEHRLREPWVLVKEPNGSQAAPMLASTLPRARILFLLRDGRDVLESLLDAVRPGSWLAGGLDTDLVETPEGRLEFLRRNAWLWIHRTTMIERATEQHDPELRLTVRYEDLLENTATALTPILDWLGVEAGEPFLRETVAANAFEGFPAEATGRGHASRFAQPGHWRDGLSGAEQALVNELLGPKLRGLGYDA